MLLESYLTLKRGIMYQRPQILSLVMLHNLLGIVLKTQFIVLMSSLKSSESNLLAIP